MQEAIYKYRQKGYLLYESEQFESMCKRIFFHDFKKSKEKHGPIGAICILFLLCGSYLAGSCLQNEKIIYLTFDAGYEAGYTEKILDVLKKHNVKASFFITGHYLNTAEDLVKRMIDEGHIVGNHSWGHKSFPTISREKMAKEILKQELKLLFHQNYPKKLLNYMKNLK